MNQYKVNGMAIEADTKAEAARKWAEATYQWPMQRTTARAARGGWYTVHYTNHGSSTIYVEHIPRGVYAR